MEYILLFICILLILGMIDRKNPYEKPPKMSKQEYEKMRRESEISNT